MLKPLTRRKRFGGLFAAGAAALIIAAGCGGGDGGDRLSVEEYREQAQRICREADRTTDSLDVSSIEDLQAGIDAQREQIDALRELNPPEEFESQHDEAIGILDDATSRIDDVRQRIADGEDPAAVIQDEGDQIQDLTNRADELARELGLDDCVNDDANATGDTTTPDTITTAPTPDPTTTEADATPSDVRIRYLQDVTAAASALSSFGEALQNIASPSELEALAPTLTDDLDQFDESIADMGEYTLPDGQLEDQRARLTEAGPRVSDVLRRFADAAGEGDLAAIQGLVPEIQQALTEFSEAASGSATP